MEDAILNRNAALLVNLNLTATTVRTPLSINVLVRFESWLLVACAELHELSRTRGMS